MIALSFTPVKAIISIFIVAGLILLLTPAESRSGGISYTDSEDGCFCHSNSESSAVSITISGFSDNFTANEVYDLEISFAGGPDVSSESNNQGGFSISSSLGTLSSVDGTTQIMEDGSLTHTEEGNNLRSWNFSWTAPSDDSKKVTFRFSVNSVNGDGEPNDFDKWNFGKKSVEGINYVEENSSTSSLSFIAAISVLMSLTFWRKSNA